MCYELLVIVCSFLSDYSFSRKGAKMQSFYLLITPSKRYALRQLNDPSADGNDHCLTIV